MRMSWFKPMPFLDALMAGKFGDVERHLKTGVNPNSTVDGGRAYPMHYGLHAGPRMVRLLVAYGGRVEVKDRDRGRTPLHGASFSGLANVVLALIEAGANANALDNFGHTPLFVASFSDSPAFDTGEAAAGRRAVVSVLTAHGAVLSMADKDTANAMGSLPEAERFNRQIACADRLGDLKYSTALFTIRGNYPFLHDAYRLLRTKARLSADERTFIDKFELYERRVR